MAQAEVLTPEEIVRRISVGNAEIRDGMAARATRIQSAFVRGDWDAIDGELATAIRGSAGDSSGNPDPDAPAGTGEVDNLEPDVGSAGSKELAGRGSANYSFEWAPAGSTAALEVDGA